VIEKGKWMKTQFGVVGAALVLLAVAGCTGEDGGRTVDGTGRGGAGASSAGDTGSIRIDGSSTVFPITEAVAEEYRSVDRKLQVTAGFSGTGGGFKKFIAGEIDICDASRPITSSEKAELEAKGIGYVELEVAFDGLAVIAHPANDWCDCLTVEQLKELWRPESGVSKWSDLNPEWPDEEIKLYGPGPDSGTFDYFTEAIVGKSRSSRQNYEKSEDDNALVSGIKGSKYALGYFGYAYYAANTDSLKLVGVDGGKGCEKPSLETVRGGSYSPLSRPLYIYVRNSSLQRPEVARFVRFYLDNSAELATEVGYVPVSDASANQNDERLKAATNP
jgi:phosphate transport system substrate-binding protein